MCGSLCRSKLDVIKRRLIFHRKEEVAKRAIGRLGGGTGKNISWEEVTGAAGTVLVEP